MSLYEQLGGEAAVVAAVDRFYEKAVADERTRPFFAGLDMKAQIQKQIAFMTRAFGGPAHHQGRDLGAAHAHLVKERGLSDVHFDAIAEQLEETLQELGVEPALIAQVLALIGTTRDQVLGRGR
jgi:hemoglobin